MSYQIDPISNLFSLNYTRVGAQGHLGHLGLFMNSGYSTLEIHDRTRGAAR